MAGGQWVSKLVIGVEAGRGFRREEEGGEKDFFLSDKNLLEASKQGKLMPWFAFWLLSAEQNVGRGGVEQGTNKEYCTSSTGNNSFGWDGNNENLRKYFLKGPESKYFRQNWGQKADWRLAGTYLYMYLKPLH